MSQTTKLIGWYINDQEISILKRQCHHWSPSGLGEAYYLYSATGDKGTWHLRAARAWEDADS